MNNNNVRKAKMKNNKKKQKEKSNFLSNALLMLCIPVLVAFGVIAGQYVSEGKIPVVIGSQNEIQASTVLMDEFLLNLKSPSSSMRYMKLEVSLSTKLKDGEDKINDNVDKIRDAVIETVSKESVESMLEKQGNEDLKIMIRESINERFNEDLVDEVYIINSIIQ